jgi:hypothetical protein
VRAAGQRIALDDGHGEVLGENARREHPGHAPADHDRSTDVHALDRT